MAVTTRIRFLGINICSADGWADGTRQVRLRDLIRSYAPSVVLSQENNIFDWFVSANGLGINWAYRRHSNSNVMWDTNQHDFVSYEQFDLPTPSGAQYATRRMVGVKLRMKATQQEFWAYAAHFMPGTDAVARDFQAQEMAACLDIIGARDPANSVFGVDQNHDGMLDGPRLQARTHAARMFDLRNKLATKSDFGPGRIAESDYNTFTGYNQPARENEWIDDLYTGDNMQPYYARVVDTWTNDVTDHAGLLATISRLT